LARITWQEETPFERSLVTRRAYWTLERARAKRGADISQGFCFLQMYLLFISLLKRSFFYMRLITLISVRDEKGTRETL